MSSRWERKSEASRKRAVEYAAAWNKAHPDCVRATAAAYYAKNRERITKVSLAYREAHREQINLREKKRRQNNPEKEAARHAAYHEANREKVKARQAAWEAANPEAKRVRVRNRRASKRAAEGTHTVADIVTIRKAQADRCAYCRTALRGGGHADHIIAIAKGGSNWPANLQLVCALCNERKHTKDPIAFAQSLGRLL